MKFNKISLLLCLSLIYIVFAPPREGKTFYVTYKVLQILKKGKEKVFTNYPVIFSYLPFRQRVKNIFRKALNRPVIKPIILSSYVWTKDLVYENIYDSTIVIDEAYRDFSSRDYKSFTVEEHTFFATNGHNLNDIWLIAQNYNRVDVIIREMANYFIFIKKKYLFLRTVFLWFVAEYYVSEEDFRFGKTRMDTCYMRDRLTMKSEVMKAYDTHYFRDQRSQKKPYETWDSRFSGGRGSSPAPLSSFSRVAIYLARLRSRLISHPWGYLKG